MSLERAGTGVGEPLGLLNSPAAIPVTRATASTIKWVLEDKFVKQDPFNEIPGAVKWAGIVFGLIVLQVALAFAAVALRRRDA